MKDQTVRGTSHEYVLNIPRQSGLDPSLWLSITTEHRAHIGGEYGGLWRAEMRQDGRILDGVIIEVATPAMHRDIAYYYLAMVNCQGQFPDQIDRIRATFIG